MLFMKMVRNFCILGGKVLKKREIRYHSYFGYSQFPLGYRLFESNGFIHFFYHAFLFSLILKSSQK